MNSPVETINRLLRWLGGVFRVLLPSLPLPGVYARLAPLFRLPVTAQLPEPTDPLPWTIPVAESWSQPIPGLDVALTAIRIQVAAAPLPGSPPEATPELERPHPTSTPRP